MISRDKSPIESKTESKSGSAYFILFGLSFVPAILMALLVPIDILDRYSFLREYVSICERIVPGIGKMAAVSSFPAVTKLVLAYVWSIVPIQVVVVFLKKMASPKLKLMRERRYYLAFVVWFGFVVGIGFSIYLFEITPKDLEGNLLNEWVLRSMSSSRFWLGVIGSLYVSVVAMTICIVLIWLYYFPKIYFSGEKADLS